MAKQVKGPLTDKHLKILNEVIALCKKAEGYCNDCEKAGLNVDPEKRKNKDNLDLCLKLKSVFFPTAT